MYKYNEKDAAKIAKETLRNAYNIKSRKALTILESSIDSILWDGAQSSSRDEIYNSIMADVRFGEIYFNGYGPNVAHTATEKVMELIKQ